MKRILCITAFSLLTISLFAQPGNNVEMHFRISTHEDTAVSYIYKHPYLVRNIDIYSGFQKTMIYLKDTVFIDSSSYAELKEYVSRYKEDNVSNNEVCAARTPVYAGFSWGERKETETDDDEMNYYYYSDQYALCHINTLPVRFLKMRQFLDRFYTKNPED